MFRVLSAEEAEKAIRWKAPAVSSSATNIIHAKGPVSPMTLTSMEEGSSTNPSQDSTSIAPALTSAPALQAAQTQEKVVEKQTLPLNKPSVDMLQSSYDEGYSQGYIEGTKALMDSHVAELASLILSIRGASKQFEQGPLEQEVYGLSLGIARVLLQREIEVSPDALAQLVKAGLDQLPSTTGDHRELHLHPLDAESIKKHLGSLSDLTVVEDDRLGRGECQIQSQSSTVHTGVDNWLNAMAVDLGILFSPAETSEEFRKEPFT